MSDPLQNQASQSTPTSGTLSSDIGSSFPSGTPNASPSDFFPPTPPASTSKKFGGKKVIATFLGILLLVGGLGIGVVLVEQPQLIGQKASDVDYIKPYSTKCETVNGVKTGNIQLYDGSKWQTDSCPLGTCSNHGGYDVCDTNSDNGGCFLPGTQVKTSSGSKNIEDVTTNDKVLSFNDRSNKISSSLVSNIYKVQRDYYYNIASIGEAVSVTAEHPFYIGNSRYLEASRLKVGDTIFLLKGGQMVPSPITHIEKVNQPTTAYNLTVDGNHTFFADSYAVHNKPHPAPAANCSQYNSQSSTGSSTCKSSCNYHTSFYGWTTIHTEVKGSVCQYRSGLFSTATGVCCISPKK